MPRTISLLAALLVVVGALAGCSSGSKPHSEPTPSSAASSAPAPVPPPAQGACHQLSLAQAGEQSNSDPAVPCTGAHTSVTYAVGGIDRLRDGHLLAVDSDAVRRQVADKCASGLAGYAGGGRDGVRLSQLRGVGFTPTPEQAQAGADWFRCDVIALDGHGQPMGLRGTLRKVLDKPKWRDSYTTCGTTTPGKKGFTQVPCSQKHAWRAEQVVPIHAGASYLGKAADAAGNATCRSVASRRADGALSYTWSFVWPTRQEWNAGTRYGICWLPQT